MKKMLIIGEMFSENLGDGIICETVNGIFKQHYVTDILDLSGRSQWCDSYNKFSLKKAVMNYIKEYIKRFLHFFGYNKTGKNLTKIYENFQRSFDNKIASFKPDVILFAGGQMFIDTFIYQISYVCSIAKEKDIKVIFNCVGNGKRLYEKELKRALNEESVIYISVRDGAQHVDDITSKKVIDCYDNAILCNEFYGVMNNKKEHIGIGIMYSPRQSPFKQVRYWRKLLNELVYNKVDFKVFTNGSTYDQSFAEYILKSINLDVDKYLLKQPKRPIDLIKIITSFKAIVSMRLHSHIVAYSYDIPTISISWDNKVNAFFKKIGCGNYCFDFNLDVDTIIHFYNTIDRYTYNEKIRNEILQSIKNNISNIDKLI